jgi:hypothetical protein
MMKLNNYSVNCVLFLAAFSIFAVSLQNGFVGDDLIYFIGNRTLKSFDIRTILMSGAIGVDYCPLRDISLAIDYQLWGENPFGFHLTNLILYGGTVVALRYLFEEFQRLVSFSVEAGTTSDNRAGNIVAALLFAVHPLHGEVVYAINHRGIILAGLAVILSCIFFLVYLRKESKKYLWYAASLTLFIAAVLSKEYSIVMPLVLVFFVAHGSHSSLNTRLLGTIPFFIISAIFYYVFKVIAISAGFIASTSDNIFSDFFPKIIVALEIVTYYLFRILNIDGLGSVINDVSNQPGFVFICTAVIIIAVVLWFIIAKRQMYPQLLFGFMFYTICLIPVLNFFKTYPVATDRFVYIPSVGLFFAITAIQFKDKAILKISLVTVVVVFFSILTVQQSVYWKNNLVFWEYIADREPTFNSYANLGMAYMDSGNIPKAIGAIEYSVRLKPDSARSYNTLGALYGEIRQYDRAIGAFETSMALDPGYGFAPLNLAKTYLTMGDRKSAEQYLNLVKERFPQLRPDVDLLVDR